MKPKTGATSIYSREEWNDVKYMWTNLYLNCGCRCEDHSSLSLFYLLLSALIDAWNALSFSFPEAELSLVSTKNRDLQSRSQSFVPLDQRSENEISGSIHFETTIGNNRILVIRLTAQSKTASMACYGECLKWMFPELSFSDRWSRVKKLREQDYVTAWKVQPSLPVTLRMLGANLTKWNLIGCLFEMNSLRMLRKLNFPRGRESWCWPKWVRPLTSGVKMRLFTAAFPARLTRGAA